MSPAINEELLVLAMCAYGGLVLMVCYDAIRIFRRTMALFEWLVGKRVVEKCAVILTKIMKTLLKPLKKLKKVITIKSKSILTKHKSRKNSHTNKNTKNKKTDKRQKELTYKKSKSQKKTGQRLKV